MRLALNADVVKQIEGPHVAAGVPLMQRAAEAVTEAVVAEARTIKKDVAGVRVLVLVGKGLNGGDGLIAASMLVQRGLAVSALVVGDDVHLGAMHSARAAGVDVLRAPGAAYDGAREVPIGELVGWSQIVVDGMLGACAASPSTSPRRCAQPRAGRSSRSTCRRGSGSTTARSPASSSPRTTP
jgi:NAD(P)H-hydrate repair Nnr-like enzyme with NAD(P)H-hydrate epimerase domain